MRLLFSSLLLVIVMAACSGPNSKHVSTGVETTIWVNSYRVDCFRQNHASCLQIQEGEVIDDSKWENYFSLINGFEYVPGYLYKLRVSITEPNPSKSVGNPGPVRYTLIEALEKKIDPKLRVNDLWSLIEINGNSDVLDKSVKRPFLEIHVTDMTLLGNGPCNNISGTLDHLTHVKIKFNNIASTRMACLDLELEGEFLQALENVHQYNIKDLNLHLMDDEGNDILIFRKVD